MTPYGFRERLNFSQGIEIAEGIRRHLLFAVPSATGLRPATPHEDRCGTDLWIERRGLPDVSVDFKHRSFCPIERFRSDDAAIEVCSIYRNERCERPGWTVDESKRTDLLVYTWPSAGTPRRFWILYFPTLCRAAMQHREEWARLYGETPTPNEGYVTINIYVPRSVIVAAMRGLMCGVA